MARQLIVLALILVALVGLVSAEEPIIATAATPEAPSGATAATPEGAANPGASVDLSSISTIPSTTPPSPTMAAGESSADEAAAPIPGPPKDDKKSDAATLKVSTAAGVAAVAGLFFF